MEIRGKRKNIFVVRKWLCERGIVGFLRALLGKKFKKSHEIIWLFGKVAVLLHSLSGTKPRGASSNRELHKRRRQEDKIQRSLLVVIYHER